MDLNTIGTIAELLGALGVIASLAYLANQVKNAAQQGREEAARSVLSKLNASMEHLASSHERSDLWVRGSTSFTSLRDEAEEVQFSSFLITFFRAYEELYFYRSAGVQWDWGGFEEQVRATLASPGVREWWSMRGGFLSAQFRKELEPFLAQRPVPLYGPEGYYKQRLRASLPEET